MREFDARRERVALAEALGVTAFEHAGSRAQRERRRLVAAVVGDHDHAIAGRELA